MDVDGVEVTVSDQGSGRAVLLLHGGAGPMSVEGFAALLGRSHRVITPTHPGFGGTDRPAATDSVRALAELYVGLLDALDLRDVTVVGNSIGGWIAAEVGLLGSPRVGRVVLVDAVGIDLPDVPRPDFFSIPLSEVIELSYADPDAFRVDLDAMPDGAKAALAGNRAAMEVYAGGGMADPTLLGRLGATAVPALVAWGPADRMVPLAYGQAYAAAIPGARLELVEGAGHLPQLEQPDSLAALIESLTG